jgi:hypothetical protein
MINSHKFELCGGRRPPLLRLHADGALSCRAETMRALLEALCLTIRFNNPLAGCTGRTVGQPRVSSCTQRLLHAGRRTAKARAATESGSGLGGGIGIGGGGAGGGGSGGDGRGWMGLWGDGDGGNGGDGGDGSSGRDGAAAHFTSAAAAAAALAGAASTGVAPRDVRAAARGCGGAPGPQGPAVCELLAYTALALQAGAGGGGAGAAAARAAPGGAAGAGGGAAVLPGPSGLTRREVLLYLPQQVGRASGWLRVRARGCVFGAACVPVLGLAAGDRASSSMRCAAALC